MERESWRWTQWTILFALVAILALTVTMSETYKKQILKVRAKKLGIPGPSEHQRTMKETLLFFVQTTIERPMHMLFTETIVTLFDLYVAVNFGILNGFFAAFPYVFEKVYGFNLGSVGLTFLGQAVGSIIGFLIVVAFNKYYYLPKSRELKSKDESNKLSPEYRLFVAMLGAPMLPIS